MKVIPFRDFGIDDAILVLTAAVLLTVCRPTFRAILAETRLTEAKLETTRRRKARQLHAITIRVLARTDWAAPRHRN